MYAMPAICDDAAADIFTKWPHRFVDIGRAATVSAERQNRDFTFVFANSAFWVLIFVIGNSLTNANWQQYLLQACTLPNCSQSDNPSRTLLQQLHERNRDWLLRAAIVLVDPGRGVASSGWHKLDELLDARR